MPSQKDRRGSAKGSQSTSKSPLPNKKNKTLSSNQKVVKNNDTESLKSSTSLNVLCKKCKHKVLELNEFTESKDESIQCDDCNMWFHRPCSDLSSNEFDFLLNCDKSILWKCNDCISTHGHENKRLTAIEQKLDTVTNMLNNLGMLEERIMEKVNVIVDKKINDSIKNLSEEKIEGKIKLQVEEFLDEQNEIEKRKNNIIFYNLPEENIENDLQSVKDIIQKTTPELSAEIENIKKDNLIRLGKFTSNSETSSKPRPLKVSLPDVDFKDSFIKNSRKIRNFPHFKNIHVKKDMTRRQQKFDFDLRKEKNDRKNAGEDVIVYNDKVILRTEHPHYKPTFKEIPSSSQA